MGNQFSVPYTSQAPGQVQVGDSVIVYGRPFPNCKRFSINLSSGPSLDHDVALHFNPRFDEGCVVRNSRHNGSWANEERAGHIPLSKTLDFQVKITAQHNRFQIFVNNMKFCDFLYRMPKEMINFIHIRGDVIINFINMESPKSAKVTQGPFSLPASSFAAPLSYPSPDPPPYSEPMGPINYPPVPLNMPVQGGMLPGRIIYFVGRVNPKASRFTINLMCGPSTDFDIALTFDVRLRWSQDTNVVVRNSKQNGKWGAEERGMSNFPFMPGANFEIMILAENAGYKVAVNNQHYTQFNHRIYPFTQAAHLNITGDITLTQIRFQ